MPVYVLNETPEFPNPNWAVNDGLLAIGGDLSSTRLLKAYSMGIFPWYSETDPIMWWSPGKRMILIPEKLKVSKSFSQTIRNRSYDIQYDRHFQQVINHCASVMRHGQDGTWITEEMKDAYLRLHEEGYAHSVETYYNHRLAGGLYGVSLGRAFFGESMFHLEKDASKLALFALVEKLSAWNFLFIDAQVETAHLKRLGAEIIPRKQFLQLLTDALKYPTIKGKW
jgi:leucyl/phenylalanyl-tRNA--protein transferase